MKAMPTKTRKPWFKIFACEFCLRIAARHAKKCGYYHGLSEVAHHTESYYYFLWMAGKHKILMNKWAERAKPYYNQVESFL